MKRNAISELMLWKEQNHNMPLVITGVKGVGKTYLALEFAKNFFEGYVYINFENNCYLKELFKKEASIKERSFMDIISEEFEIPLELLKNILIILDEFSFIDELDFFINQTFASSDVFPNIIMISSLGGISGLTFDYKQLILYPMDFGEFLSAIGSKWYSEVIEAHFFNQKKIPGIVHDELLELFDDYMCVGGMPAAVNDYIAMDALDNIPELHLQIKNNMALFLTKCVSESEGLKIRQVIEVMPAQLMKNNKKFQLNYIRKGVTQKLYQNAIETLSQSGFSIKCKKYDSDSSSSYKLYFYDSGSLKSLIESVNLSEPNITTGIKTHKNSISERICYENYIAQVLSYKNKQFGFWESASTAQLEFVLNENGINIPIEIKTANNSKSKSLSIYTDKYKPPYSIRISHKNFDFSNGVKNIPYYAIYCI